MFIKYLGASLGAVHDSVAAVEREGVLKFGQTFLSEFITGINHPPVCLSDYNTVVICRLLHQESFLVLIINIGSSETNAGKSVKNLWSGVRELLNGQP